MLAAQRLQQWPAKNSGQAEVSYNSSRERKLQQAAGTTSSRPGRIQEGPAGG